jgi:RHS repeat-associated protein
VGRRNWAPSQRAVRPAHGRRTNKTINATQTGFLYDSLTPVQELNGSTVVANLLIGLGIDEILTRTDGAGASHFLTDALGSTVALSDGAGAMPTSYTYTPFGAASLSGSATGNAFDYTGREDDSSTGVKYYRARYYHPTLQRFLSEDPTGFKSGINKYAYVDNDPLGATDPFGLCQIRLHFRPLGPLGPLRYSHTFITTTDDYGVQYFAAFPKGVGPSIGSPGDLSSGGTGAGSHMSGRSCGSSESSRNFASGNYGVIDPKVGPYTEAVARDDYAPFGTFPTRLVRDDNESCSACNEALSEAMTRIGQSNIPYDNLYNNSNAAAWTALKSVGIGGPSPKRMWAPGFGNDLLAPGSR